MSSSSALEPAGEGVSLGLAATGRAWLGLTLMLVSGFAGLGYQIVWTQQCALWLGHESAAVLAVLAAFFGGIALGAMWLGRLIERSGQPARWYALCEAVIGLWGAALLVLMPAVADRMLTWTGEAASPLRQWTLAFGGTFIVLAPSTMAMGATLPAMEKILAGLSARAEGLTGQRSIAACYAANTLGAVLGVLSTAFWLVPQWGLSRTALLCVAFNLLCAGVAWVWARGVPDRILSWPFRPPSRAVIQAPPTLRDDDGRARLLCQLAATGCLGIGYEVLVVRVLSQVAEDTVYTFAMLLAVYLVGTAIGAACHQRWRARLALLPDASGGLLVLLAMACLAGMATLWGSEALQASLRAAWPHAGMAGAIAAEGGMALAVFALPTVVMGALFSQLAARAHAQGIGFGRALGVNTLGAALAPMLFGVLLAPALGPARSLVWLCAAYLLLALWASPRKALPAALLALTLAAGAMAPPLAFVDLPPEGRVLRYRDGVMAAVSVVQDADGVARLRINNRQQEGSSATLLVDGRQALLPMLLHPGPSRALFLGLGTGVTAGTAAEDPTLDVDAVELLPEVIEAANLFASVFDRETRNPRLHVMPGDARRYVRASRTAYDLIVSDNFQPARSGSAALYTVEHFRAVQARLAPGGLFCQWLPLHQLDRDTLRSIVHAFMLAYPRGVAILANNSLETPVLGLVARQGQARWQPAQWRHRLATQALPRPLDAFGLDDEFALLGSIVAGPAALSRFADGAPANTDDRPVVAYLAPRATYAPQAAPSALLVRLLREWTVTPDEVLALGPTDAAWSARLSAYWSARQRFIEAGTHVNPTPDVHAMLAQVQGPLLDILKTSPDFRPAYEPLLGMAMALAQDDPVEARRLLQTLTDIQPAWPQAREALRQLP